MTSDFLRALWPEPVGFLSAFTIPGKQTLCAETVEDLAAAIQPHVKTNNVYVRATSMLDIPDDGYRGSAEDSYAMPGIWADIDILGDAHKAKDLPPDIATATAIANCTELPPSIIVHSGNGIQAWWVFKEPVAFSDKNHIHAGNQLVQQWQAILANHARSLGYRIDATHDLARIMRLPGTLNLKDPSKPKPVTFTDYGHRYNPSDFLEIVKIQAPKPVKAHASRPSSPASLLPILDGCSWLRHCRDDAATLPYPEWYRMLGLLAACRDGSTIAHAFSEPHPGYSKQETDLRLEQASKFGPPTCEYIQSMGHDCSNCQHYNKISSPIVISRQIERIQAEPPWPSDMLDVAPVVPPATVDVAYEANDDEPLPVKQPVNALADSILKVHSFLNYRGVLYKYSGTHWEQIDLGVIRNMALWLEPKHTNMKRRSEIANRIFDQCRNDHIQWRNLEKYEVPVLNGVVDLRTMSLRPHRQKDYLQTCIPHNYDPQAQCPEWMRCIDTYFGGEDDGEAKANALQEFFGYCLMPHATYKRALFLQGDPNCGKSTIPFLMREIVGPDNVCGIPLEDIGDARKIAPLRGKLVNLLPDLKSGTVIDDGGFKRLVGSEEPLQFDEKYLPSVMDVPICKVVFVANDPPIINDRSRAVYNRLVLLVFRNVIPESQQDRDLQKKLKAELPGILLWALLGAQRLYQQGGKFSNAGAADVENYRASQNPVAEFIELHYNRTNDVNDKVSISEARKLFSDWNGKPVSPQWFTAAIRSLGINVHQNPVWLYRNGIKKKDRAIIGLQIAREPDSHHLDE